MGKKSSLTPHPVEGYVQNTGRTQEANLRETKRPNQKMEYRTKQRIHNRGILNGQKALKERFQSP